MFRIIRGILKCWYVILYNSYELLVFKIYIKCVEKYLKSYIFGC